MEDNKKISISICMIIKNEEDALPGFLKNIVGLADEVVIVDTGSTDKSLDIVENIGIKKYNLPIKISHYSQPGPFHYVKAKNYALGKGAMGYILFLDADERMSDDFKESLQEFLKKEKPMVATVRRVDEPLTNLIATKDVRIFKNGHNIFYEVDESNRIHHQLVTEYEIKKYHPVLWHCRRQNHWIHKPQYMLSQLSLDIYSTPKTRSFFGHLLRGLWLWQWKTRKDLFTEGVRKNGRIGYKFAFMRGMYMFLTQFFVGLKPREGYKYWEDPKHRKWNDE
ncbi:glycosyltransferase [Candidatus Pacearchaeota archaeon]|nr:glycosyltransferase [Candidatus Pacearchaeota archaeon]